MKSHKRKEQFNTFSGQILVFRDHFVANLNRNLLNSCWPSYGKGCIAYCIALQNSCMTKCTFESVGKGRGSPSVTIQIKLCTLSITFL